LRWWSRGPARLPAFQPGGNLRAAFELARGAPDIEENLAHQVFRHGGVAHDAQNEAVNPYIVTRIKDVHRGPVTIGNAFQQHFVRGRLSSDDAPAGCGVDGDDVLHDSLPVRRP
jgi:hypothetical protein